MKCKCGSQFLPLDEEQKKCITCLVSEGCKKTGRKCWNDEPEMEIKNYSYVKNENYMFLRSDVKPTYYYWVTPERFFELYKILNNSKRLGNLYLPSQMRENRGIFKHTVRGNYGNKKFLHAEGVWNDQENT